MLKRILICIVTLLLQSCHNSKKSNQKSFPFIIDSITIENPDLLKNSVTKFPILYLGDKKDTICPDYLMGYSLSYLYLLPPPPSKYKEQDDWFNEENYNNFKKYSKKLMLTTKTNILTENELPVEVQVDTMQPLKFSLLTNNEYTKTKSYPTLILNHNQQDTLSIQVDYPLNLTLQAKDTLGQWHTIQTNKRFPPGCGTGTPYITLLPNQLLLTLVTIPTGNHKTQLRIKYGISYSNVFYAHVNNDIISSNIN